MDRVKVLEAVVEVLEANFGSSEQHIVLASQIADAVLGSKKEVIMSSIYNMEELYDS